jgi:Uma2 family endonuclease
MSAAAAKRLTVEEYLAMERESDVKHEFYDGQIFALAGESRVHNRITANLVQQLSNVLEDSPCEVYPSDMRVKLPTGLYVYPDVSIVSSEPQFEGDRQDVLLNPLMIVEVLSPSTEVYDRGTKFHHYSRLPSLKEYVLVSQDWMNVEHHFRTDVGSEWVLARSSAADATVRFAAIDRTLSLSAIYAKVKLEKSGTAPHRPNFDGTQPR